jgi:hypothetical protein
LKENNFFQRSENTIGKEKLVVKNLNFIKQGKQMSAVRHVINAYKGT